MRILTVRQPWALHIIQSGKDVENRSRNIAGDYRGPVAIHAAKVADEEALRALPGLPPNGVPRIFHYGAIIGVVDLLDVHHNGTQAEHWDNIYERNTTCSPWADHGPIWHLKLANPRSLKEPIPYKGALGLRHLDDDVVQQIQKGLEQ